MSRRAGTGGERKTGATPGTRLLELYVLVSIRGCPCTRFSRALPKSPPLVGTPFPRRTIQFMAFPRRSLAYGIRCSSAARRSPRRTASRSIAFFTNGSSHSSTSVVRQSYDSFPGRRRSSSPSLESRGRWMSPGESGIVRSRGKIHRR